MPKLYFLIGLPGSGKSTWAKQQNINIFSSDEYREKLFGDINNQNNNGKLFEILHHDCYANLANNNDSIYDATNISRKDRRQFLSKVSNIKNIEKIAVVFATPIEECKFRNSHRSRVVPEYVIDNMVRRLELPLLGEGFNKIEFINSFNTKYKYTEFIKEMKDFNQKNPHHSLTLGEHCAKAFEWASNCNTEFSKNETILEALKFHDVGKLYTQILDDHGIAHYYNHENVGAYIVLTQLKVENREEIATLINYHMLPYVFEQMNDSKKELTKKELSNIWDKILFIHEADEKAH